MKRFRFVNIGKEFATLVYNLSIRLNEIQSDIIFEYTSEIIEPDRKYLNSDGIYSDEYFHDILKEFMRMNKFTELPIGITNYNLN